MVHRRMGGATVVRVRILPAVLVFMMMVAVAAGCILLGSNPRSSQSASASNSPAISAHTTPLSIPFATGPSTGGGQQIRAESKARALSLMAGLPLMFEPNQGQQNLDPADRRAKFLVRGSSYGLYFGAQGAILSLPSQASLNQPSQKKPRSASQSQSLSPSALHFDQIEMKLAGANANAAVTAIDPLPGKTNYLIGADPAKWHRGIPQFARLRYENIYPGINLVFYGNQGRLEYDFQVAPGADPAQAELQFDGAKQLALQDGDLVVKSAGSSVRFQAPRVYQQIAGREQPVEGKFVLRGDNRAGFAVGPYDHSRELVIDPILTFSTWFGGSGNEGFLGAGIKGSTSVAIDVAGAIYLAGSTTSPNLPATPGVVQPNLNPTAGAQNVYIAKIAPAEGSNPPSLVYVTYLGGSGIDSPAGIAVDALAQPNLAGTTTSPDFPHTPTNAYQSAPEPGSTGPHHVFVTQFNNTATALNYSSYLSGNGDDIASGMTIDTNQQIFITGTTTSTDPGVTGGSQFPATAGTGANAPPFQAFPLAPKQFFVTQVNAGTGGFGNASVAYSTFFGGGITSSQAPIVANGGGIAVDINDNVYFTGTTNFIFTASSKDDFPILNAYQPCLDQPPPAVPLNPPNCANNLTFPDAFVAKLTPIPPQGGAQLQWSTYFGGSESDSGNGVAVDTGAANVYIVGTTNSPDFVIPTTVAPFQRCLNNLPPTPPSGIVTCTTQPSGSPSDAFVARFNNPSPSPTNPSFTVTLTYFSYLGGPQNEAGYAITVDNAADAIVTGFTTSPNLGAASTFPIFPTPNDGIQNNRNGPQDAFLARINTATQNGQNSNGSFATYFGGSGTDEGTSVTIDGNQNIYFAGDTNSGDLHVANNDNIQKQLNGGFDSFITELGPASTLALAGQLQLGQNQVFISAGNPATFVYTLTNNGPDVANSVTVTDNLNGTGAAVSNIQAGVTGATGTCTSGGSLSTGVVCTIPQLQSAGVATITITMTPAATASGNQFDFNGGTLTAQAANSTSNQVTVTAQMSDYTISATPNNFTLLAAGDTATYEVELIPHPIYASNISLTSSGVPAASRAVFTSTSVSLANSSSGGATLNISTTPRPIVTPASLFTRRVYYAVWLSLPGMALLGLGTRDKRRRRILGLIALCAVFGLILLVPACSHGTTQVPASGTPAGTYTITITASSGGDSKSASVTLTVP
jgi:Beta-propeller repeat/Domain of unknown function DUF11